MVRRFSLGAFLGILLSVLAYQAPTSKVVAQSSVQEELSKRNLTLSQARAMARQAGINPDNPAELSRFAKANGVSQTQIDAWLQEMGMSTSSTGASSGMVQDLRDTGVGVEDINEVEPTGALNQAPRITTPTRDGLPYFGYSIFSNVPDAFKPSNVGPVDEGYIIGPEDEMRLALWGATEFQYELAVDAEGRIFIPSIGQITVAGQTLKELRSYLKTRLSQSYSGLVKDPPTIFLDVTLTRLRPIRVFVIGELNNPGGYTFSSYSTLFNVLYGVGGPTVNGSLRDIQLIRDGEVITSFDLYDFLLKGLDTGSIRLQNNDRIFIPRRKNEVTITGPIGRPAIYELKEGENLNDLLTFAGNLKPQAYGKRFHVNRIIPLNERQDPSVARTVLDYNLEKVLAGEVSYVPENGDRVQILNISDRLENIVYIQGAVYQPGSYEINGDIQTVKDLIAAADGVKGDAFTKRLELVRTNEDLTKDFFSLNFEAVMNENATVNMKLQRLDRIQVYSNSVERITNKFVQVFGAVQNPGTYEFSDGMNLSDVILNAGGFTEGAYLGEVEVSRLEKPEDRNSKSIQLFKELITDDANKDAFYHPTLMDGLMDEARTFGLMHRDKIYVRNNPRFEQQATISIRGEVVFPGTYTLLSENEKLTDVFRRAGGLTVEGYAKGAKLYRNDRQVIIDISEALMGRAMSDMELLPGDEIVVPRVPNTVAVSGNVGVQGLVKFVPGKKVSYYLERVGGMQKESEKRVLLTQPDGTTYSVKRKGWFRKNPEVYDGAQIIVQRKPVETQKEKMTPREFLQETTAILTSTLTVILLIDRLGN
jgi:protein involved in polysaccharide export with SLBB domain